MNTAIRNQMPDNLAARRGATHDPATGRWSSLESLVALLIDEVRQLTWVQVQSKTDKKVPRPEPLRRPGLDTRRVERKITLADAQRMDPRLRGLSESEAQAMLDRITKRR